MFRKSKKTEILNTLQSIDNTLKRIENQFSKKDKKPNTIKEEEIPLTVTMSLLKNF